MRVSVVLALTIAVGVSVTEGGIGDSAIQLADRYGAPKDTQITHITDNASPLVEGAIHHTYEFQGWKIRAAFLQTGGSAVRMTYQKAAAQAVTGVTIRDDELQAIITANTPPGMTWKAGTPQVPGSKNTGVAKMFESSILSATGARLYVRTDGITAEVQSRMLVCLEAPEAAAYEARLKAAKESKAKASVPKF